MRIDEAAEPAVEQRLARAVGAAADDRNAAGRGLDQDDPEPFAEARHHIGIGEIVMSDLLGLGDPAGEDDAVGDAERDRLGREPRPVGAVADHEVFQVREAREQARHRLDHRVDALVAFLT